MACERLCIVSVLLLLVTQFGYCIAPPICNNSLKIGELTISYQDGLEPQARELATISEGVLPAGRTQLQHVAQYLGNKKVLTRSISQKLGQIKAEKAIGNSLKLWPETQIANFYANTLNHWRIYRLSDVRANGTFTDGATTVIVDPNTGSMVTRLEYHFSKGKPTSSLDGFTPFFVNDDATFRYNREEYLSLADAITAMVDSWIAMRFSVIHEITEGYLLEECKLDHPYTRWFNEGVANWVMYQLVIEEMPEFKGLLDEACLPGIAEPARDKVNLWAWRQSAYDWSSPTAEEQELSTASYRFSTQLIQRFVDDQPEEILGEVLKKLAKFPRADSNTICAVINTVTGKEARNMLFDYIPAKVKEDIQKNRAEGYFYLGKNLKAGNTRQCFDNLMRAIEVNPLSPETHLYLAWSLKKLDNRIIDADKEIIVACLLGLQENDYLQFAQTDDPDVRYICTRIRELAGEK